MTANSINAALGPGQGAPILGPELQRALLRPPSSFALPLGVNNLWGQEHTPTQNQCPLLEHSLGLKDSRNPPTNNSKLGGGPLPSIPPPGRTEWPGSRYRWRAWIEVGMYSLGGQKTPWRHRIEPGLGKDRGRGPMAQLSPHCHTLVQVSRNSRIIL